jgi:hypothetical protein
MQPEAAHDQGWQLTIQPEATDNQTAFSRRKTCSAGIPAKRGLVLLPASPWTSCARQGAQAAHDEALRILPR